MSVRIVENRFKAVKLWPKQGSRGLFVKKQKETEGVNIILYKNSGARV